MITATTAAQTGQFPIAARFPLFTVEIEFCRGGGEIKSKRTTTKSKKEGRNCVYWGTNGDEMRREEMGLWL